MPNLDGIAAAIDRFRMAAVGTSSWEDALNAFADSLNSRTGQLIAVGRQSLVPLNLMTRIAPEAVPEFLESGGGDPGVNSRIRVGHAAPELAFRDDADFTHREDCIRTPSFGAWVDRYDIGYTCISALVREKDALIGLAVLRSKAEGEMRASEKRAFLNLAGHARAAVILRNTVEGKAVGLLASALEQSGAAAAICDIGGRIRAITTRAEALLASGRYARMVDGTVVPNRAHERIAFDHCLSAALHSRERGHAPPPRPVVLTDPSGNRQIAEIVPLPKDHGFNFAASVMIVFPGEKDAVARRTRIARQLFGFTDAEETVASHLLRGRSPIEIATLTGRTVGTVRNHVHRILSKSESGSQVEFIAFMSRFD